MPASGSTALDATRKVQREAKAQQLIDNVLKPEHVNPPPKDDEFTERA